MMLWQIRIHKHILNADQRDVRTIERYRKKFITEALPMIARRLAGHPFICGSRFTAADCMVAHALIWAHSYGLADDQSIKAYLSRISQRPAFRRAFADAQDFDPLVPEESLARVLFTG